MAYYNRSRENPGRGRQYRQAEINKQHRQYQHDFFIDGERENENLDQNTYQPHEHWRDQDPRQRGLHRSNIQSRGRSRHQIDVYQGLRRDDESKRQGYRSTTGRYENQRQGISHRGDHEDRTRASPQRDAYQGGQQYYDRESRNSNEIHQLRTSPRDYEYPGDVKFQVVSKLGHYSLDRSYQVHWNNYGMKFFTPEICPNAANIFEGFDEKKFDNRQSLQKEYGKTYAISQVTEWLKRNPTILTAKPDFVVKHFFLKKIMCSPYERQKGWAMEAVLHKGTIYMSKLQTGKDEALDVNVKMAMYGGNHFEDLVTTKPSSDDSLYSDIVRYYPVLYTNLLDGSIKEGNIGRKNFSILLSAEVDCVGGDLSLGAGEDINNFVELKTAAPRDFNKADSKPQPRWFKVLDWWAHCKLAGAPKLCIGFKDNDGSLLDLVVCSSDDIPGIISVKKHKNCVLNFLHAFFRFLKKTVTEEDIVYGVHFFPERSFIDITKTNVDNHLLLSILKDVPNIGG